MKNESSSTLLLIVSVACLFAGLFLLLEIPDLLIEDISKKHTKNSIINKSIASIDKILSFTPGYQFFTYTSEFDSPFRKHASEEPAEKMSHSRAKDTPVRPKLILKGILLKNKGLAIIEDEKGQTYIKGTGESILDQQIISINVNKVVIRDRTGAYELAVEEY